MDEFEADGFAADEFGMLRRGINAGQITLGVHIRKMNSPGSPVYRYAENIMVPIGILLACLLAARAVNVHVGAAVLAAGMALWLWKWQPRVKDGVYQRSVALALSEERLFDALWAKGALTLTAEQPDGGRHMATRRDDWRAFVRGHVA
jgi:hypothetical protein